MPEQLEVQQLFTRLVDSGFEGDLEDGYAERVVAATDNSIYQVLPKAILYPKTERDIQVSMDCI